MQVETAGVLLKRQYDDSSQGDRITIKKPRRTQSEICLFSSQPDHIQEIFREMNQMKSEITSLKNEVKVLKNHITLKDIFGIIPLPRGEVALIMSNDDFQKKLNKEMLKIAEQVQKDDLNPKTSQEIVSFEELETKILENVLYNHDLGFVSQKSPTHQYEDRVKEFKIQVGEEKFPGYAVFDGHGGNQASKFCQSYIGEALQRCINALNISGEDFEIANALKIAFVLLDVLFIDHIKKNNMPINPGCTGICAFFFRGKLFIANCGDCRAILILDEKAEQLSYDYKACQAHAQNSVFKRGGKIIDDKWGMPRVDGSLAITRAIGDEHLRKSNGMKSVTPRPQIMMIDIETLAENKNIHLLLSSDGLTDCLSTKPIGKAVKSMRDTKSPCEMAEILLKETRERKGIDDITIGLIDVRKLMGWDLADTQPIFELRL